MPCKASFGTTDEPLYVYLRRPILGDVIQLSVVRKGYARLPERLPARVQFENRPILETSAFVTDVAETHMRWHVINLPLSAFQDLSGTANVQVRTEGIKETFALAGISMILKRMDECVTHLRRTWHVEESGRSIGVQRAARGDLRSLFSTKDYPDFALMRQDTATVRAALLVDESGTVVDCMIIESEGSPILAGRSCGIIQARARFTPAIGLDGNPARSATVTPPIIWQIGN
jgi:hypothetical protein